MTQPVQPSDFQKRALSLAQQSSAPAFLQTVRQQGLDEFGQIQWPGRKTEMWKYTTLRPVEAFANAGWPADDVAADGEQLASLPELDATRLVFVDGIFDGAASDELPDGVRLFSQADESARLLLDRYLGKIAKDVDPARRNLFAALNDAWLTDGVLVYVPKNATLEKPLYVVHLSTAQAADRVANQRLLVVLEQGASAELIEHYLSTKDAKASFVNTLTEIHVGDNARLSHTRLNLEHEASSHVGAVHINLQRSAVANGFTLAEGGELKRLDYQINHCGEGAELTLNGLYLGRNEQHVDYHTTIEHRVPNCTSQEVFRGIVGDKAKAVFNGRFHIHEDAQKTLAELNNRNLLTSNTAEVDTKPELEIYADDVRCAHGATISQLDETALYYLQSRGIEPLQARMMLSYGFVNEVLETLPHEGIRTVLQQRLRQRFVGEV